MAASRRNFIGASPVRVSCLNRPYAAKQSRGLIIDGTQPAHIRQYVRLTGGTYVPIWAVASLDAGSCSTADGS
jgi:hypothetical protein